VQLTLQVSPALAFPLRNSNEAILEVRNILALIEASNASIEAMHANTQDRELSRFFTIDVEDDAGPALQSALMRAPGVNAAYFSPGEALP
jgi:hypothetical protein